MDAEFLTEEELEQIKKRSLSSKQNSKIIHR